MELPERLRELVEKLGQAVVEALANDPGCKELTQEIQQEGFDVALMLEATVALHRRDENRGLGLGEFHTSGEMRLIPGTSRPTENESPQKGAWSDDDKAFLKTFRISLD